MLAHQPLSEDIVQHHVPQPPTAQVKRFLLREARKPEGAEDRVARIQPMIDAFAAKDGAAPMD